MNSNTYTILKLRH